MSQSTTNAFARSGARTYAGLRRSEWAIGATSVALNLLVNGVLPERYHVPASLTASATVAALAAQAGAGVRDQGLAPRDVPRGVLFGFAAAAPIAAALGVGLAFKQSRELYGERRITGATPGRAAYETFIRIPIGTALPEEIIFRGALLGLLSRYHPPLVATGISSLLFGLWHVAPTLDRIDTHAAISGRPPAHKAAWVALVVGATSGAGCLLAWLRYRSRSVVAPWMAHSAANAAGFAVGWLAARLAGTPTDIPVVESASVVRPRSV